MLYTGPLSLYLRNIHSHHTNKYKHNLLFNKYYYYHPLFFSLKLNISNKLNKEWLISILYELAIEILAWFTQTEQKITLVFLVWMFWFWFDWAVPIFQMLFHVFIHRLQCDELKRIKGRLFCSYFIYFLPYETQMQLPTYIERGYV